METNNLHQNQAEYKDKSKCGFHRRKSLPQLQENPLTSSENPASFFLFLPKMTDPNLKPC